MAHPRSLVAPFHRLTTSSIACSRAEIPRLTPLPYQTIRCASNKLEAKKRKTRNTYLQYDVKKIEQFPLVDAMQYVFTPSVNFFFKCMTMHTNAAIGAETFLSFFLLLIVISEHSK